MLWPVGKCYRGNECNTQVEQPDHMSWTEHVLSILSDGIYTPGTTTLWSCMSIENDRQLKYSLLDRFQLLCQMIFLCSCCCYRCCTGCVSIESNSLLRWLSLNMCQMLYQMIFIVQFKGINAAQGGGSIECKSLFKSCATPYTHACLMMSTYFINPCSVCFPIPDDALKKENEIIVKHQA